MKNILLLLLATQVSGAVIAQNCAADFNYASGANAGDINFTDASTTAPGSSPYYSWSFGDGNSSNAQSPSHAYSQDGMYGVCLTIIDSLNNCYDYTCDTIVISGLGNGTGGGGNGTGSNCQADFTHAANSLADPVMFQNTSTSGSANPYYYWDFGDGNYAYTENPTHQFGADGVYNVCLTLIDSAANCTSTFCDTVLVQGINSGSNCDATFWWYQDSTALGSATPTVWVYNNSTGNNLSYSWDFGDGNTSNQTYPMHTYAQDGIYNVCLTIDDGNGCTDTYCDSIYVITKSQGFNLNVVDQSTGIELIEEVSITNLFPNPVQGNATIAINATSTQSISLNIVDITGKVLNSTNEVLSSGNNSIEMNFSNLSQGIYFAQIVSESGMTQTLQFVKR